MKEAEPARASTFAGVSAGARTETPPGGPGVAEGLLEDYRGLLFAGFSRRGLGHHDAEDCAQETLLRVQRSMERYVPRAPFRAFLRRVARSVHADWCRRERRRSDAHVPLPLDAAHSLPTPGPCVSAADRLDLQRAVASLSPKLAQVVELSGRQGLSYRDVAECLDIPVGTVKSRMFLAVRQLRKELGHDG